MWTLRSAGTWIGCSAALLAACGSTNDALNFRATSASSSGGQSASSRAAECTVDSQCPANMECYGAVCRSACTSNAECVSSGLLCDTVSRHCVQCVVPRDCRTGLSCDLGVCRSSMTGGGGSSSAGGAAPAGGLTGVGGAITGGFGGTAGAETGGAPNDGGASGTGGAANTGGSAGTGTCGNGVREIDEQCDASDFGTQTCATIGLGSRGSLGCTVNCNFDTRGCKPILVLFGGSSDGGYTSLLDETWEYDGGLWRQKSPSTRPSPRFRPGIASMGSSVVLFGGFGAVYLNDTWTWDGTEWKQVHPAHSPSPRYGPAMATLNGKVVLFGGWATNTPSLSDTWEWDGVDWTEKTGATSPPPRDGSAFANVGGRRLVLFGDGSQRTWLWEGDGWKEAFPQSTPPARRYIQGAALNGGVVLFGGAVTDSSTSTFFDDTWNWEGSDWGRVATAGPPVRRDYALGSTGTGILLFGGQGPNETLGDIWEWTGTTWTPQGAGPSKRMGAFFAAR